MVSVIFAVLEVSFWALTTVVKLPWKFLTLIYIIWRKTIFNMADGVLHPAMWHDHDIDFARWLHAACVSGISEFTKWQQYAMWYVALGWNAIEFVQTSAILELYIWFRFRPYQRSRYVILHQSAKLYPNRTALGRRKCRHADFQDGGYPPS